MSGRSTALVLGWGSSTPRQVRPFADVWTELGLEATAFIPDTLRSLVDPGHFRRQTAALARCPWDVVHALSDNGFIAWSLVLDDLLARGGPLPRAVVLDSCPGVRRWATRRGFAAAFGRGLTPSTLRALGRDPVEVHPVVTPVLEIACRAAHRALPTSMRLLAGSVDRVLRLPPPVPHLVVAGPGDHIVPEDEVRAFVAASRERGHPVETLRVLGSGHVGHLRRDPAAYRAAARRLLDDARLR